MVSIFASLAEFERDLIRERTQAGLEAARARDRKGGRLRGLPKKAEATAMAAETLYREGRLGISKPTLYAYLNHRGVNTGSRRNLVSDKNSWRITKTMAVADVYF